MRPTGIIAVTVIGITEDEIMAAQEKSTVGDGIAAANAGWTFSDEVARTFSGHVSKSVPLYDEGHDLFCALSDFFVQDSSICYELGSSTGVLSSKLARRHANKKARFVGIETVPEMIAQARVECGTLPNLEFVQDDINLHSYERTDLFVSFCTIQFVPPYLRQALFDRLYQSLNWGGAILIYEKVRAPDARFQDYMSALYTDFKLERGYSPDEIIAKARSLKRVQEPFSTQGYVDLFKRAGFVDVMSVIKWVCFEGLIAIK
jgi:tRNA (cmo5U34)-methyltransferase